MTFICTHHPVLLPLKMLPLLLPHDCRLDGDNERVHIGSETCCMFGNEGSQNPLPWGVLKV
ncbi:Hypothetical protein FKW44_006230, partial [Caligus rogercresseyi]